MVNYFLPLRYIIHIYIRMKPSYSSLQLNTSMLQLKLSQRISSRNPVFLVIDDDPGYNEVCRIIIKKVFRDAEILTFQNPTEGLDFIGGMAPENYSDRQIVLFLDIHMHGSDGFAVLNSMMDQSPAMMNKIYIYMLSSSIEPRDMIRSLDYSITSGYISKPLTIELLEEFFVEPAAC